MRRPAHRGPQGRQYRFVVVEHSIEIILTFGLIAGAVLSAMMLLTPRSGFSERYARYAIERAQASGASAQEIEATRRQMETFKRMYDNPWTNAAITFL